MKTANLKLIFLVIWRVLFPIEYRFQVEDIFNTLVKCGVKSSPIQDKLLLIKCL